MPLRFRLIAGYGSERRTRELIEWMKNERSFDFQSKPTFVRIKEIAPLVAELIHEEQCVVWFMDRDIAATARFALEIPPEDLQMNYESLFDDFTNTSDFEWYASWLSDHSMFLRVDPEWSPTRSDDVDIEEFIRTEYPVENAFHRGWAVDLVSRLDETKIDQNRADDLIVRTTFMIHKSEPLFLDWEELI